MLQENMVLRPSLAQDLFRRADDQKLGHWDVEDLITNVAGVAYAGECIGETLPIKKLISPQAARTL